MKKLIINSITVVGSLSVILSYSACQQEPKCDSSNGDITVYNYHDDPYNLSIDDVFNTKINAWDSVKLDLHYSQYDFKLVQASGYDSIPNTYEKSIGIDACTSIAWDPK